MYGRILVPLDGSAVAERALDHAEALARCLGSTVVLLRSIADAAALMAPSAPAPTPAIPPVVDAIGLVEAEREEARAYLDRIAADLTGRGVPARAVVAEGSPADRILAGVGAEQADLVVMTTHGRGGLGRLLFGSVADAVVRHAPCPVLVVRVTEANETGRR